MNPSNKRSVSGEPMPSVTGSRKRILLSRYATYEEASVAKIVEKKYPQDQLQIKKRLGGKRFDLVARVFVNNPTNTSVENTTNE